MRGALAIIGAGRVGRALGKRLHDLGYKIGAVVTCSEASARKAVRSIGGGSARATLSRDVLASRLILICTPDDRIAGVADELARIGAEELHGKVVLHTSGALDSQTLQPLREHGASVGSMHPLQSFSGVSIPPLEGKAFAIEGDPAAVKMARQIARALGGLPVQIAGGGKALYHTAASFAAGHVLAIEEAATQILTFSGMTRSEAVGALLQLTRQVLDNFERLGPRAAWTGPLARGDWGTVYAHMTALGPLPAEFAAAYASLNDLAGIVLGHNAPLPAGAGEISRNKKHGHKAQSAGGKA
jgi:predicted short-subunit dehydrogenase-like oxidoreductase (DUF2520 family)